MKIHKMNSDNDIRICVIGTGYVGLTTGVCLADLGFKVTCVDKDREKISELKKGIFPIHEPGLDKIFEEVVKSGGIKFTDNAVEAIKQNNVIFLAVGTPSREDGSADTTAVFDVIRLIAENINEFKTVVLKSTVPMGTSEAVDKLIRSKTSNYALLSNPEFLRQGKALMDFKRPHRIVIGGTNPEAIAMLKKVYEPVGAPIMVTTPENAEIIKYASNSFLAMKISYINEIANLCEKYNADVKEVAKGMGMDPRIGSKFLDAGVGFGGSCFPKDAKALLHSAKIADYDFKLLSAALEVNERQKLIAIYKLKKYLGDLRGKTIGLLGLAFKAGTDDIREASSIVLIEGLLEEGAKIKAHDPKAEKKMRTLFSQIQYCDVPYDAAENSDALIVVTEWDEFKKLDLAKVKGLLRNPLIIDGRNIYDPEHVKSAGFTYEGIGR
ncbi:MAG: UDP-glucose/GDP-mannose dehydrogenase family protein [Candidatus Margulisiibacteriota bacterium]|nr:UDP-glucose/GDP-mannose dehydrogenase family protein [Candidatus Margulisiibacteriota bacterium]